MNLFNVESWVKAPADRDVIARWTIGGADARHDLAIPQPEDPARFEFLALGDTGNADATGPYLSPQEAIANEMVAECALAESAGQARFIVHMGDVVYMTGERRLYDRNFRRPYTAFLTPESTVDNLVFRVPFLPVPGNHDYYDIGGWARWLARFPIIGAGVRAITHRVFSFTMPEGGSDMGRAFMQAFVDLKADTSEAPVPYVPGHRTRLPNRYYRFQAGSVDLFALDSNTLDAPPPWADKGQVRADAIQKTAELEARARSLETQLRHAQRALDQSTEARRAEVLADPERLRAVAESSRGVQGALQRMREALERVEAKIDECSSALAKARMVERRWLEASGDLVASTGASEARGPLRDLEAANDEACSMLSNVEECVSMLPTGAARTAALVAMGELERLLNDWSEHVSSPPQELCDRLKQLGEDVVDVQRELALERRRAQYRPEDYDTEQIRWLNAALTESERERPNNWRVLYLHHPLYTAVANHCERPDVLAVRENLMSVIKDRVHLVLSGHSHAFEWMRSTALPNMGLIVTGGGGQVTLRRSLVAPRLLGRLRDRYDALRNAGIVECAVNGRGPAAADGLGGKLFHYLRIQVTPEALIVRPIGVRYSSAGFRREEPMPVYHTGSLPEGEPRSRVRGLAAIEIRRDQEPRAVWA